MAVSKNTGASFCQVVKIRQLIHDRFIITSGSQKWNGNAPSFKNKLKIIRVRPKGFVWYCQASQERERSKDIRLPNISILDPKACIIKYLILDSVSIVSPR